MTRRRPRQEEAPAATPWAQPAPIRGWNARDSLARMQPGDAIALDNWFPGTTTVAVRPGSASNATLPSGKVIESLLVMAKPDGTFKRFAGANDGFYDFTAGGAIAAVAEATTTARWEYVQINVGGTPYLWCAAGDGSNKCRLYNGTANTWTSLDGASTPVLTGPTSANISNVSIFKYRLILTEKDSLKFWYGPLNAVGGVFNAFDLGQVFTKGGYLVACGNWTLDAGDGADDRFIAITSEGEVAVYQGTDPSSVSTFALIGVYQTGKPIGKRCFVKLAGEIGILTESGLWPISTALAASEVDKRLALTDRIQNVFIAHAKTFGANFGWSMSLLPKGPAIIVNVPLGGSISYQFVMNTITGAWCRFTNWNASCMAVAGGKLYFALNNIIKEGWTGQLDVTEHIPAAAACAFTHGKPKYQTKTGLFVRPQMSASGPVKLAMSVDTDYQVRNDPTPIASQLGSSSLWDTALFDSGLWADSGVQVNSWKKVSCNPAKTFSLRVAVQLKNISLEWSSTDFISEAGVGSLL